MYYIDFLKLNYCYISGINHIWSWYIIPLYPVGFSLLVQSVLICGFPICEFYMLIKFIYNPQMNVVALSWSFMDMPRVVKIASPDVNFPN